MGVVALLVALLLVGAIVLKASDRLSHGRISPAERATQAAAFERRLRCPDWAFYESHLQRSIPGALQALFSQEHLFLAPRLRLGEVSLFLSPVDAKALQENWVAPGVLPFAYSEADPIYLKPGANTSNAVFITYHDSNESNQTEELAPSVEAFAAGLRVAT